MFRADSTAMKFGVLRAKAQEVANMYRVRLTVISRGGSASDHPYRLRKIAPQTEPTEDAGEV